VHRIIEVGEAGKRIEVRTVRKRPVAAGAEGKV
jgi:hypothetical protein